MLVRRSAILLGVALAAGSFAGSAHAYGWPIRPFFSQHPIRGYFGDPRTSFDGPPSLRTLLFAPAVVHFHGGVDISAPDGTSVYPVASGFVHLYSPSIVGVSSGGAEFQYWHIAPRVANGEFVTAHETVLGTIKPGFGHVHFTEVDGGRRTNPLLAGHLSPFADPTRPKVESISFRRPGRFQELSPPILSGEVELVADAFDRPWPSPPGAWSGMRVTPSLVTWHVRRASGKHAGQLVIPPRVAADFRTSVPDDSLFWHTYARGTYQNMAVFRDRQAWLQPGAFLFKLTRTPFNTRALADGFYDLTVTATDERGHSGTLTRRFTVLNFP